MPSASSIQLINDANGTAYAFLEDNGLLWQCQWNPQAQRWDKGTVVPGAYGGETLQALYLENLWPTSDSSGSGAPGIVLAYRVGEGEAAKVYATLGQWGSDGELSWSEPLLLSDSGSVIEGIALTANGSAGFQLVAQTREATNSGTTPTASTAPRKDSELIERSFTLRGNIAAGYSLVDTTASQGAITATSPAQPISSAADPATTAAPAQAVGGNTEISRSALLRAPSTATSLRGDDTQLTRAGPQQASEPTSTATSGWIGNLFYHKSFAAGTVKFKAGWVPGGFSYRWQLQSPPASPPLDWHAYNKPALSDLIKQNQDIATRYKGELESLQDRLIGATGEQRQSILEEINENKLGLDYSNERVQLLSGLQTRIATNPLDPDPETTLALVGSLGIGAYGTQSVTNSFGLNLIPARLSSTQMKGNREGAINAINGVYGDDLRRIVGEAGGVNAALKKVTSTGTIGLNANTTYSYTTLLPKSPDFELKSVSDSFSASFGYQYQRSQRLETGGYVQGTLGASFGFASKVNFVPAEQAGAMPSWLKWLGWGAGDLGVIAGIGSRITNTKAATKIPTNDAAEDKQRLAKVNAAAGLGLTLAPPLASISQNVTGSTLNYGVSATLKGNLRFLYKSVVGLFVDLNDSVQVYPLQPNAFSTGIWQNTLTVKAGAALPLGVNIPLLDLSWTMPRSRSTGASLPASHSAAGLTAASDPGYPFTYAPAAGSTLLTNAGSDAGLPVAGGTPPLQLISLAAYGSGAVTPAQASTTTPVVLTNGGAGLVDGTYTGIPVMGVLLPGSTPATLGFTVLNGSIQAASLRIETPGPGGGQYLQLPQTTSDSGLYALIPDVFSTGILPAPAGAASGSLAVLLQQLPLITIDSSRSGNPLTFQKNIAVIQPVIPLTSATGTIPTYPNPSPSDNSLQSYTNVPVSLSGASGLNQATATVGLSNGVIVKVLLDQPLMFGDSGNPLPSNLTLSLDLQSVLGSGVANPSYTVNPQSVGLNNVVEDHSYQANPGFPANAAQSTATPSPATAVWLEDSLNDQWLLTPAQAAWPVFNRVVVQADDGSLTYLNASTTGSNGVVVQTTKRPSDVSLQALYNDLTDPVSYGAVPNFSAASTPAVVSLANDAAARFAGASAVFWVEAADPVIPQVSSDGSQNYQAFLQALYGRQRINYRLFDPRTKGWTAPNSLDLYAPDQALIRHLRSFNVQVDGSTRTLLVWDETSIDTIQGNLPAAVPITGWISGTTLSLSSSTQALHIGALIGGTGVETGTLVTGILTPLDPATGQAVYRINRSQSLGSSDQPAALSATNLLPPTVLKAGFINTNANSLEWSSLFSDAHGQSTITTIPWDQNNDIGVGIESLTAASQTIVDASGVARDIAVLSWSENVRTPYVQSVLNDEPLIYLQFANLQPGFSDINIGSTADASTTGTYASSTGLNLTIASALPKSGGGAVQNVDGTGVLLTGTGSQNALTTLVINSTPNSQLSDSPFGPLTGSISGTTLTVTALSGALEIGDLLTGPGLLPDTQITGVIRAFDPGSGSGTYSINQSQTLSSTSLEALANPAPSTSGELGLAYTSFIGSISGTTLSVSQLNGSLAVGDWIEGQGVNFGTTITAVQSFDAASGSGNYTLSDSYSLPASALIATPSSSVPYSIEFWTKLPAGSNADHGAGLVAFGQPSEQAVGAAVAPSGWLMTASFSVQRISYAEAAAQGSQQASELLSTANADELFAWGWSLDATGANTTTLGGNGGSNLYSNALNISNLFSGETLAGVDAFLSAYGLTAADLVGVDGLLANSIALLPGFSLAFNNALDPATGLPVSNLNAINIDTTSSQLNSGLVQAINASGDLSADASKNSKLKAMFQALWDYQEQYAEAKVGFTLDPASTPIPAIPGQGFEQYGGHSLDFAIAAGPAISVNKAGQLVFDVSADVSITSAATTPSAGLKSPLPSDLRDDQWHHVVATYLPDYRSYTINGVITQVPTNQGTASLYVDNQLVASAAGVSSAYIASNVNDSAVLLANNAGGAIDQFALYNKALLPSAPLSTNPAGSWPAPSQQDALAVLKQLGYPATEQTANPGAIESALTEHWLARNVDPNAALLATFHSSFTPSSSGSLIGSWSQASPLNPTPAPSPTTASAAAASLQQDLVIAIRPADWLSNGWFSSTATKPDKADSFDPAGRTLSGITLNLTPTTTMADGKPAASITRTLSPAQVLIGNTSLASLKPGASSNLNYTLLSATPALNLLVAHKDPGGDKSNDLLAGVSYSASVTLSFADTDQTTTVSNTTYDSAGNLQTGLPLLVNSSAAGLIRDSQSDASSNSTLSTRSQALATASVLEAAPLRLNTIDSGIVLNSTGSSGTSNDASTGSAALSFGQSQAFGWFLAASNRYSGWLAVAQPSTGNAGSDPAGRVWIQYTGDFTSSDPVHAVHTAVTETSKAPITWLNALANSNFSPDAPNRPLLNDALHPAAYGGLLIQADPTVGWGQNFGQTMLVADVDGDGTNDLVISAPAANEGGKVVIIDGQWIAANLTNNGGSTILNLANPENLGPYVTVLSPPKPSNAADDASIAAFGWALAFDTTSKTLYIGAPNYSRTVGPDSTSVPIGAVYHYQNGVLSSDPAVGMAGSTSTNDVGGPSTSYWGAQLGASLAVSDHGALAVGAPGVQASLLYSGTEAVQQLAAGSRNTSTPYGQGALLKVMLPKQLSSTSDRLDVVVSSSDGTANADLVDIVSNNTTSKKSALAKEESAYMQAIKELQTRLISKANLVNNSAIQTAAVGSVYLFSTASSLGSGTILPAKASSTFYGPNSWNTLGDTDFGASLSFADFANTNADEILAIGAPRAGGPGAVYLVDTSKPFASPQSSGTPTWLADINLGSNQYLAHLASDLTLYGAEDQDQFGSGLVDLGDVTNSGYSDLLITAPNASSGAGSGYVVFGGDNLVQRASVNGQQSGSTHNPGVGSVRSGAVGQITFADGQTITTPILTELGHGLSAATGLGSYGAGDVDANGNNDILLGAGGNGQAYLTYGHNYLEAFSNLQLQKLASDNGYLLDGLATNTQGSLRSVGDFNGDGYDDFISIQPGALLNTVRLELGANTEEILADYPYNYYSFQVAPGTEVLPAGDINGDGYSDLALFLQENLSTAAEGNFGAGSTTGILYGRPSDQLPLGSGFGLLAPSAASGPTLSTLPSQQIPGALSTKAPAMLAVGSTIYAVWCDETGNGNLWLAQSRDGGNSWSDDVNLTAAVPSLASGSTPSLAVHNDKLYLAFLNGSGQLTLSSWDPATATPTLWSTPTLIGDGTAIPTSADSPALLSTGDALSVVWLDAAGQALSGTSTATPDLSSFGPAWAWASVAGGTSPNTPALVTDGSTVYMAMRGENNQLYWCSSSNGGTSWGRWQELPSGMTTTDAPSLAIVNGKLYLTYLGAGNQELNITQLTNASTNSWTAQTVLGNQTARSGLGAVAISETVGGSEGLAIYYVANNSTGTILRTWSEQPLNANNWSAAQTLGASGGFTSSSPLAVTRFQGNTVLAYQGDADTTNTTAYLATAGSSPGTSSTWSTIATLNTGNRLGVGLSSDAAGVLLNTSDSGSGQQAIYRFTPPSGSGNWSESFYTSRASISSTASTSALLSLPGTGSLPQLLLAAADPTQAGAVDASIFYTQALNSSWSSPTALLERSDSTVSSQPQPIAATAAPSATLVNGAPVLAVNNNGEISVYVGNGGRSFSLASSFNPGTNYQAGTTAPGITSTDTGLALSYRNGDGSVSLQQLTFLNLDGTPVDGVQISADGSLDTSNADLQWQAINLAAGSNLGTNLATQPLSVNGTLLLGSVSNLSGTANQVRLDAVPALSNPTSTTWLNSTIQLPDGRGGWTLEQRPGPSGSSLSAVGDITGDGNADLLVTAEAFQGGSVRSTGLRLITGAATSSQILAANDATANSQSVQLAAPFDIGFGTPVASLSGRSGGASQITLSATSTTSGQAASLSASFNLGDFRATAGNLRSAQTLFGPDSPVTGAVGLGLGFGNLSLNNTGSFGDLNADGYLDHLEGTPTTVYGADGLGWHVWSIRAAGDANGNGTDDVLLSLVPPETVLNGQPQWIQPALLDGALFKVDKATNSFSLNRMRKALNPNGKLQAQDLNSSSSTQPWPLLQSWLEPILAYEHPATDGSNPVAFALSTTATSGLPFPTNVAASVSGEDGFIYLLSNSAGAVSISQYDPLSRSVLWTQAVPTASAASTSTNPASYQAGIGCATIYEGRLYFVATYDVSGGFRDNNGNVATPKDMVLCSIAFKSLAGGSALNASDWSQQIIQSNSANLETYLSPSLVSEDDRLGLYFAAEVESKSLNLAYFYVKPQDGTNAAWVSGTDVSNGLIRANNGDSSNVEYVQLSYKKGPTIFDLNNTQNVVATRFQGNTYVAYTSNASVETNANIWVIERPADPSQSGVKWNSSNRIQENPQSLHLAANETQLILTAWKDLDQGYSNVFVFGADGIGDASASNNSLIGPASTSISTSSPASLSSAAMVGAQLTLMRSSGAVQTLATPWSSVKQPSLAGTSIDGNIDTNGDGFMDLLVSDPSDPRKNVDNQYVLFGGDYLNIASEVGTPGGDVMLGTPLADVIYSIQGADQVSSSGGADVILTGAGDDSISIQDNAFIRIDAGPGFDQLSLEGLANQSYDFRLNVPKPEYFAGTKLRDIELISSLDYGANTLSFDAAAINAINADRVLFLVPDAADSIALTEDFSRNTNFDISFGGTLWSAYAAAPASATPGSANPALVYVATPTGQTADWIGSNVSTNTAPPATAAMGLHAAAPAPIDTLALLPTPSPIAGRQEFGNGLTLLAYKSTSTSTAVRFAIERRDSSGRQVIAYHSNSANSSAGPGSQYRPVAGLLVFESGETRQEVTVPFEAEAIASLRAGSLSLKVEELDDLGQRALHLLLAPEPAEAGGSAPPVMSGFQLTPDSTGEEAILSFRADINGDINGYDKLLLTVSKRSQADSTAVEASQTFAILDAYPGDGQSPPAYDAIVGALALDNDQRHNGQVRAQLKLNFKAQQGQTSVQLAAPELQWQSALQLNGDRNFQLKQEMPLSLWRADSGSGGVSFGLQGGGQTITLLRDALGGRSGSITPQTALDGDPLRGWRVSEGLAVGSRAVAESLPTGIDWTPTASRGGQQLALLGLSQEGNQITASFAEGVTAVFGIQSTGAAPSPTAIRPMVEVQRLAGYNNGLAFYALDSITGMVDGLNPGQPGYMQKALARSEASGLLLSPKVLPAYGAKQIYTDLPLDPNRNYGALLLVNGARSSMYSSFAAANPEGAAQVINLGSSSTGLVLGFEDLPATNGDMDYNDLIVYITNVSVPLF